MHNRYNSHGDFKIEIDKDVIVIDAWGPWNQEFFTQFHQQLYTVVHQLTVDIYGALVVIHGQGLPVNDAIDEHIAFLSQGNVTALAVDLSCCSTAGLSQDVFSKIYTQSKLNFKFFDDNQAAKAWLAQQLSAAQSE